jgi:hypothetical protein
MIVSTVQGGQFIVLAEIIYEMKLPFIEYVVDGRTIRFRNRYRLPCTCLNKKVI